MCNKKFTCLVFFFFSFYLTKLACAQSIETSEYIRGYLHAKLEDKFQNACIELAVERGQVIVYRWPCEVDTDELEAYICTISDYPVVFDPSFAPRQAQQMEFVDEGSLIPEVSKFFPTMLAEPHKLGYSAGYRTYDKTFKFSCLPISIGDQFSLYQFKTNLYGRLYFGIEACVWADFEARSQSLSLINADYFIGFPLTYIADRFAAKVRVFHESSHLGDEFLLENPYIRRVNPSMEVADIAFAYHITDNFTPFVGYAYVLRSDESYRVKPNGFYYGFNYFMDYFQIDIWNIKATPYIATFFSNYQNNHWGTDSSMAIGYQWDKSYGHKLRLFLEGHDGFSSEGQFSKKRTRYLAIKLMYGY